MIWPNILISLICASGAVFSSRFLLHMFQLEGYKVPDFTRWLVRRPKVLLAHAGAAALALTMLIPPYFPPMSAAAFYAIGAVQMRRPPKKPLAWTARAKRLFTAHAVLCALIAFFFGPWMFPPLSFVLAAALMHPVEEGVKRWYFLDAKKKLAARSDLKRVGITGSYGKTSVKFMLGAILSEKYRVCVTPASFNTPMGLTRVIREQLLPEHQVLIAEMGAKHEGDIAKLCGLVHPTTGILTSVGPQHLETFGTIETITKTKYELIDALPADGTAVFAADGGHVDELYRKTTRVKAIRAGLESAQDLPLALTAQEITVTPQGSTFTLVTGDGRRAACAARVLGRHNIQNLVVCCAAAMSLGLSLEEAARGVARVEPVEHRLQLIPTTNGVTVIDDAFNSNPAGTRAALAVIAGFPGRKIVITPGMIELGAAEAEENRKFGENMADVCDVVILVGGARTKPMREGLEARGFAQENILTAADLDAAAALLAKVSRSGDVVLFENDLPDNYAGA